MQLNVGVHVLGIWACLLAGLLPERRLWEGSRQQRPRPPCNTLCTDAGASLQPTHTNAMLAMLAGPVQIYI